ncbi:hypothetical protein [Pseudovibrio denitrificans]|uniref:hypothetical protein n=1 Tax=Pseudovibrio denitrificans TaxID=258256 RepID=UPI000A4D21A4|nr:hypothetical protein [Pseudovibrio denitrificans]
MVQDGPKTSFFKKTINFCSERPFTAVLTYILIVSAIFLIFPGLDVRASNFFYNGEGSFPVSKDPFWRSVRYFGVYLFQWVAGLSLLVMLIKLAFPKIKALMDLRHPIFVVSTLILGPGLVVNAFFKNLWGRPRPRQTDIFGGDLPFIGVWQPTNHCDSNCSFVSGEASAPSGCSRWSSSPQKPGAFHWQQQSEHWCSFSQPIAWPLADTISQTPCSPGASPCS